MLVFDDSYEHEVWQRADADRIVLIVDIWHPTLDDETIEGIVPLEELVREVPPRPKPRAGELGPCGARGPPHRDNGTVEWRGARPQPPK